MGKRTNHPGLYKRDRYWWITTDPVTGKAESTRCATLKAAQAVLAQRELMAADPAYAAAQTEKLGAHCSRYVAVKQAEGLARATIGYLREKLGHAIRVFGAEAPLAVFTPAALDGYVAQRREEGAHDHTISKEVKILIAVLKSAKRLGAYSGQTDVLRPEGLRTSYVPRERALTWQELERLLAELGPELAALTRISVGLGLRLGEAVRIRPEDVDLEGGLARVPGTKTRSARRTVPILSPFRRLVSDALPGLPLGRRPHNLHRDLSAACARAGIAHASPNDFRRSHATILSEAGAHHEDARKLLGHTSTAMLDRVYARPRALEVGRRIERSIGVVGSAETGTMEPSDDDDNPAEPIGLHELSNTVKRPPEPKVRGSNPRGRTQDFGDDESSLSHPCSVQLPARDALALAALAMLGRAA